MHLYRVLTKSFEPGSFFFRESRHYSIHLKDGRQILQVFYSASVSHPRHDEIRQPPVAFNTKQTKFCLELQALKYEGWFSWSMMKFHFIDSVFLGEFFVIMLKIAIKCCWISKCQALNRFNDWILRGMLPTQKAETGAKPANYPWKKAWEKSMMFMHVVTVCLYVHLVFQSFQHTNLAPPGCTRDSGTSCWCGSQIPWDECLIWCHPVLYMLTQDSQTPIAAFLAMRDRVSSIFFYEIATNTDWKSINTRPFPRSQCQNDLTSHNFHPSSRHRSQVMCPCSICRRSAESSDRVLFEKSSSLMVDLMAELICMETLWRSNSKVVHTLSFDTCV